MGPSRSGCDGRTQRFRPVAADSGVLETYIFRTDLPANHTLFGQVTAVDAWNRPCFGRPRSHWSAGIRAHAEAPGRCDPIAPKSERASRNRGYASNTGGQIAAAARTRCREQGRGGSISRGSLGRSATGACGRLDPPAKSLAWERMEEGHPCASSGFPSLAKIARISLLQVQFFEKRARARPPSADGRARFWGFEHNAFDVAQV
jgi:hypothetical protein